MTTQVRTTRLAPSPTGALHLGNARTFLINWALARQNGWRIVVRIEDLHTPRTKRGADKQAIEDLGWLGLDWDEGPYYQAADPAPYRDALVRLERQSLIYPCRCSRRDIERAASAPHADDHEMRYPGTCRPKSSESKPIACGCGWSVCALDPELEVPAAWRVVVPDEPVVFEDQIRGRVERNVQRQVGDFVVATKARLPAYQLAVVVDDVRQGVTEVVRGDDLLDSTARQIWLYRYLFRDRTLPRWWHLPLVVGPDGRRLAKRHGDTRLAFYREKGVPPERIIGLLAHWAGVLPRPEPMSADDFGSIFNVTRLAREPVTMTAAHHQWLMEGRA